MNAYEFVVKMKDMASSQLQNIARSVGVAKNELSGLDKQITYTESSGSKMAGTFGRLKNIIAGAFAVGAIWTFTDKVVGARSEYEKFESVLINTFQSTNAGKASLKMLSDFAKETPFALNELTGSYVKLVNRGINPTFSEMTNLGDLASSQGKGFDQLTEALLDAQTGQFERLKEFGINASKHGNTVMMSFKGVNKEVANNAQAITNALLEYGKMPGVANSMVVQSKTLGGVINNLGDQWNSFLVAVGGEASGIFSGVLSTLSAGLGFLTTYLPYISQWFHILWNDVSIFFQKINQVVGAFIGFHTASEILTIFGNVMAGVLMVVDWFVSGLINPLGQGIMAIVGAYYLWNGALAVFNMLMDVNPVTWLVIGVLALIMVIGMVSKHTTGWGESWRHTVNGAKLLWQAYTDYVKANFNTVVNALMIGIDKIKLGWYKFKEAIGIGNSSENQKIIADINNDVEIRKKSIADGYKKMLKSASDAKKEFSQVGITFDTNSIKKDFQSIKDKFNNVGVTKDTRTLVSEKDSISSQKLSGINSKDKSSDKTKDGIVSGGSKMTNIYITIGKLQDYTQIQVDSTEKGINNLGEKVQEMLLRAVNSVNQMQTD